MSDSDSDSEKGVLEKFTNKLYNEIPKEDNYLLSPLSVEIVLAMVYQGAGGQTAEKAAKVLSATDKESAAAAYKDMIEKLNNLSSVTLDMANKMYVMQNYQLKNNFKNVIENSFMSRTDLVNFAENVKTAKEINQWVESKTNNKITDLVSENALNGLTRLVLVNALYFKGDWEHPFKSEDTSAEPFYVNDDETVECEMMFVFGDFKLTEYSAKLSAAVVELPYAGGEASMIIILPHEYDGIDDLEKEMATVDLTTITEDIPETDSEIFLPKFKIEATTDIKPLLEKMGLADMFNPHKANFSEISEDSNGLHVSAFLQKTYIDVNEKGTEAAAATQCGMMLLSGPRRFTADHPFMFVLQTNSSAGNTVLFVGKVLRPTYTVPF